MEVIGVISSIYLPRYEAVKDCVEIIIGRKNTLFKRLSKRLFKCIKCYLGMLIGISKGVWYEKEIEITCFIFPVRDYVGLFNKFIYFCVSLLPSLPQVI